MLNKDIYYETYLKLINEQKLISNIPVEANLNDNPQICSYIPSKFNYFGDCKNTVDIDKIWDATEMSNVLLQSDLLIPTQTIIERIKDGDRKIPKKLINWIKTHVNELNDLSKIVCGLNQYQRIAFIYITDLDTHFFFDI